MVFFYICIILCYETVKTVKGKIKLFFKLNYQMSKKGKFIFLLLNLKACKILYDTGEINQKSV